MKRRKLKLEQLESRELLSASEGIVPIDWYSLYSFPRGYEPTAYEQELLEWVNRMRTDPQGEFNRLILYADPERPKTIGGYWNDYYFKTYSFLITEACKAGYPAKTPDDLRNFLSQWDLLSPVAPLAYSDTLLTVAKDYNAFMVSNPNDIIGWFAHNGNLDTLLGNEFLRYGENVYSADLPNYSLSVPLFMHSAFAIDWGNPDHAHRDNIMNPEFTEIGISFLSAYSSGSKTNSHHFTTVDFGQSALGARTDGGWLLGVVYNDLNKNLCFGAGEGLSNVELIIRRVDNPNDFVVINSFSAGGYQIYLQNGSYTVTAAKGALYGGTVTKTFTISGENVKVDFTTADYTVGTPILDLGRGVYYDYSAVAAYHEKSPAIPLVSGTKITDSDSARLQMAKIWMNIRPDGINDGIDVTPYGSLEVEIDTARGIIWIRGDGTINDYRQVIASLTYVNTADTITLEDREIFVQVFDGTNWSNIAKVTVDIIPIAPILTISNAKVYEGDKGNRYLVFNATLSFAPQTDVSFIYSTTGGTAIAGSDYMQSTGKIVFEAGQTQLQFSVAVFGNYDPQKVGDSYNAIYNPNDDRYLLIRVSELDGVAFRNIEIRGTILDDDTPRQVITESSWSGPQTLPFQTEYGTQRFLYGITATTDGVITWNVQSDLPDGITLSVYQDRYSATPLTAIVTRTEQGQQIQWNAASDITYIIKIESTGAGSIFNQKMQQIAVTADNVVMVDHLWKDNPNGKKELQIAFNEDGVRFGANDQFWQLPPGDYRFETSQTDAIVDMYLQGAFGEFSLNNNNDYVYSNYQQTLAFGGFVSLLANGNNEHESVTFYGTNGDDYLYYDGGTGYFTTHLDSPGSSRTFNFRDLSSVIFIARGGGNDVADIYDAGGNDYLTTTATSTTLETAGSTVTIENFSGASFYLINGFNKVVELDFNQPESLLFLLNDMLVINGLVTGNELKPLSLSIRGYNQLITNADSLLGTLYVWAPPNTESTWEVAIGRLLATNESIKCNANINNVQEIVFLGVIPETGEALILIQGQGVWEPGTLPDTDALTEQINGKVWAVVVPAAWNKNTAPSASLLPETLIDLTEETFFLAMNSDIVAEGELPNQSTVRPNVSGNFVCFSTSANWNRQHARKKTHRLLFANWEAFPELDMSDNIF